jgi:hypothetical protein
MATDSDSLNRKVTVEVPVPEAVSDRRLVLQLGYDDFARAYGSKSAVDALAAQTVVLDGEAEELQSRIVESLPKVLARKLEGMIPERFAIQQISLKIAIEAKLLGSGVAGEATVTFGPAK